MEGYELEQAYRAYLGEEKHDMPGAYAIIQSLQCNYRLFVVTNGVAVT